MHISELEQRINKVSNICTLNNLLLDHCFHTTDNKPVSPKFNELYDGINFLIQNGVDVNYQNSDGDTALMILCKHCRDINLKKLFKMLIKANADVNKKNNNNETALILLCKFYNYYNILSAIKLLVKSKADINCQDINGFNALMYLCVYYKGNMYYITKFFVESGASVDLQNNRGDNALINLCRSYKYGNLLENIKLLIEASSNVDCVNHHDNTHGHTVLITTMIHYEHDNLLEVTEYLIKIGADINKTDCEKRTPLINLCFRNDQNNKLYEIVELLINSGANVNSRDLLKNSASDYLRKYSSSRFSDLTIKLLIRTELSTDVDLWSRTFNKII